MPMYNSNYYMQDLQNMRDKIDRQLQQYQQMQPVQQPITQNFQLAPQNNSEIEGKYAENIDDVKNTFVLRTGIFVNKNYTNLWVKDVSGNIKTYKLEEVVELDSKDKMIIELQKQINELKEEMLNANESANTNVDDEITNKKSAKLSTNSKSNAK